MNNRIQLLDCTLRDGAYIVDSKFGEAAIKGIISKLQDSGIEIIECGWLKDADHIYGTSYYHLPNDILQYVNHKNENMTYVVMIDWDRYNIDCLPQNDGKSIDAIRVVFPHEKFKEGIEVGKRIIEKGYKVFYQAANTLAYEDEEIIELAKEINSVQPEAISVVDTFGAMYEEDLDRIIDILDYSLDENIGLGFHSHNNQQMAFANSIHFIKKLSDSNRRVILDSSLCGMGRGAGNATTELMTNYLNTKCQHNYDLDSIMDAIDIYMVGFQERYKWGYSTPLYIAGMYCCHVNNIAYLLNNHRTNSKEMRNIIESLDPDDRKKYDYDLLERKYIENQNREIDDVNDFNYLREQFGVDSCDESKILLIAPGKSSLLKKQEIHNFIEKHNPIVIAVNALLPEYKYDYLFITNSVRYEYAKTVYREQFDRTCKILLSNVKRQNSSDEYIVNYNRAVKRGWPHFDNAVICALRLLDRLGAKNIFLAGFDGFKNNYNESYADESLPTLNTEGKWDELNVEINEMFKELRSSSRLKITFITQSYFE